MVGFMARRSLKIEDKPEEQPMLPIAAPRRQRDRIGKRSVTAHLEPQVARAVAILAAKEDRTMGSMLAEAIDDVLVKYGQSLNER